MLESSVMTGFNAIF